jgi:hypothetical protein
MFPPRADSAHAFPDQTAIGQPESQTLASASRNPAGNVLQFPTLAEAEAWLQSQGFRLVDGTCNWTNDDDGDAGVYSIDGYWGEVKAWRVEINRRSPKPVQGLSRRLILAGVASAAALPIAGGIAAAEEINLSANKINVLAPKTPSKGITPSQGIEGDPIYVAIERHRKACFVWNAADDVRSRFNDLSMTDEQRRQCNLLDRALEDARDALDDTGVDLINTSPTTLGGIARALNYIREQMLQDDGVYMPSGLRLADDTDGDYPVAWIEAFLDTIEHAARELDWAGKAVQS